MYLNQIVGVYELFIQQFIHAFQLTSNNKFKYDFGQDCKPRLILHLALFAFPRARIVAFALECSNMENFQCVVRYNLIKQQSAVELYLLENRITKLPQPPILRGSQRRFFHKFVHRGVVSTVTSTKINRISPGNAAILNIYIEVLPHKQMNSLEFMYGNQRRLFFEE